MLGLALRVWGFVGSPLGGRIGAFLAVGFALLAIGQCAAKDAALRQVGALTDSITREPDGWAAQLARCKANRAALEGALADQSAKVRNWQALAQTQLERADRLASEASRHRASAEAAASRLQRFRAGGDACSDFKAADAAVLENLQ